MIRLAWLLLFLLVVRWLLTVVANRLFESKGIVATRVAGVPPESFSGQIPSAFGAQPLEPKWVAR